MDDLKDKCSDDAIRKRIKQLIDRLGITQGQLGAIMEPSAPVRDNDVCKILSGEKVIPRNYARLARIARAGGVSLDWLLTGEETTAKSKEARTLHDWCKILFVDMPKRFIMGWDDVRIEECENRSYPSAWIDFHIKIPTEPLIDHNTGYPSGKWVYSSGFCKMVEDSKEIKNIMSCYGLSDKQKEEACINVINDTIPF